MAADSSQPTVRGPELFGRQVTQGEYRGKEKERPLGKTDGKQQSG
jgi:hypothetical protein